MADTRKTTSSTGARAGGSRTRSSEPGDETAGAGPVGTRGVASEQFPGADESYRQQTSGSQTNRPAEASSATGASSEGVLEKAKSATTSLVNSQKDRLTETVISIAQAVRQGTEPLRNQRHEAAARTIERLADRLERISSELRTRDARELMNQAADLARRQPAAVLGASLAAGLIAARFLKSSQNRAARSGYGASSRAEARGL